MPKGRKCSLPFRRCVLRPCDPGGRALFALNRYGDALSEYDDMFWASKLHFHITGISFYNFPYTFGYMFALGVYAQQEKQGKDFYQSYVALLRDTGRMTAEEVMSLPHARRCTSSTQHRKCPQTWQTRSPSPRNSREVLAIDAVILCVFPRNFAAPDILLSPPRLQVVQKHLGCSIEDPEFWRGSVRIIESKLNDFEELVNKVTAK